MTDNRTSQQIEQLKQRLSRKLGTSNDALLDELVDLGFTTGNIAVLSLIPLIAVAWADNRIDGAEREAILASVGDERLNPAARRTLEKLLAFRPDVRTVHRCVAAIHLVFETMAPVPSARAKRDLVQLAEEVAEATGGLWGLFGARISDEERELIGTLADRLGVRGSLQADVFHEAVISGQFQAVGA